MWKEHILNLETIQDSKIQEKETIIYCLYIVHK